MRSLDDGGVEGEAHNEVCAPRLPQHLDGVDDRLGEPAARLLAAHDCRDVVERLRVRDRQDAAAAAGREPSRPVVVLQSSRSR